MPYLTEMLENAEYEQLPDPRIVCHDGDVIMGATASQITSLTIVYSTVYSGADQRKHQRSASLAFVWGIHRGPVNSPHKWPVTRKMFPFDGVIMLKHKLIFAIDSDFNRFCSEWHRTQNLIMPSMKWHISLNKMCAFNEFITHLRCLHWCYH